MFLGLFKRKPKVVNPVRNKISNGVKVKRKKKVKKAIKPKLKKSKIKIRKTKVRKKIAQPKIVGEVTHYFPHVKAGVILVTKGKIALGDTLQIKGRTTDFKQKVSSIQINNVPIKIAVPRQEIGLLVKSRVRHHDVVYKL